MTPLLHEIHGKFISHDVQLGHGQVDFRSLFLSLVLFAIHLGWDVRLQSSLLQYMGVHLLENPFSHVRHVSDLVVGPGFTCTSPACIVKKFQASRASGLFALALGMTCLRGRCDRRCAEIILRGANWLCEEIHVSRLSGQKLTDKGGGLTEGRVVGEYNIVLCLSDRWG